MEELEGIISTHGLPWVLQILRNAVNRRNQVNASKQKRLPSDTKFNSIIRDLAPDALQRIKSSLK